MTAAWMAYAIAVATAVGLAAIATDKAFRLTGRPARGVWLIGLVGSAAWPAIAWLRVQFGAAAVEGVATDSVGVPLDIAAFRFLLESPLSAPPFWQAIDRPLLIGWGLTTAVLCVILIASHVKIRRDARRWPERVIQDVPVRLAPNMGPAVVGLTRGTIVIPAWIGQLESGWQQLIVMHEQEHVRAGDAKLLMAGIASVVLAPWNPAAWWQLRKLRNAIELDCDHRVLRSGVDPGSYSALLLEVARRASRPRLSAVAMSTPRSLLAWRINMITQRLPRARGLKAALSAVTALALIVVGCETPMPAAIGIDAETGAITTVDHVFTSQEVDTQPERLSGATLHYPEMLRRAGVEGHVVLSFVIDETGRVDSSTVEIVESTNRAFEAPATHAIVASAFAPATLDDAPVAVAVEQRISFTIASERMRAVQLDALASLSGAGGSPLIMIDGTILESGDLSGLSPDQIERIEVIKGAAAAQLYGPKGENGVIQIFMKDGLPDVKVTGQQE